MNPHPHPGGHLRCDAVRAFAERLMAAEVEGNCNAGYGELTPVEFVEAWLQRQQLQLA